MTKRKMMTQVEKARLYDELRNRAGERGYGCIGEAIDAAPAK